MSLRDRTESPPCPAPAWRPIQSSASQQQPQFACTTANEQCRAPDSVRAGSLGSEILAPGLSVKLSKRVSEELIMRTQVEEDAFLAWTYVLDCVYEAYGCRQPVPGLDYRPRGTARGRARHRVVPRGRPVRAGGEDGGGCWGCRSVTTRCGAACSRAAIIRR